MAYLKSLARNPGGAQVEKVCSLLKVSYGVLVLIF